MTELFCTVEIGFLVEILMEYTPRPPNGISDKTRYKITLALKDYGISSLARWYVRDTIALKKSAGIS